MNAIKFETKIDEEVAGALPELRPMLGRNVEVIALETHSRTPRADQPLGTRLASRFDGIGLEEDIPELRNPCHG